MSRLCFEHPVLSVSACLLPRQSLCWCVVGGPFRLGTKKYLALFLIISHCDQLLLLFSCIIVFLITGCLNFFLSGQPLQGPRRDTSITENFRVIFLVPYRTSFEKVIRKMKFGFRNKFEQKGNVVLVRVPYSPRSKISFFLSSTKIYIAPYGTVPGYRYNLLYVNFL